MPGKEPANPTSIRSSAVGIAYSLSRATSAALPFAAVPALAAFGSGWVFGGSAVLLLFLIVNVGLLGPRTTGRVLEEAAWKNPDNKNLDLS